MTSTKNRSPLLLKDLDNDPVKQFNTWFLEAEQAGIPLANAMTLATANREGHPSARIVLLRGNDEHGFVFHTNYESRKALDLQENPQATLLFYWPQLARQIRIEGRVEPLAVADSDRYFTGRPRGHQIGAHASNQSRVIESRSFLEEQVRRVSDEYAEKDVPRPRHWGGYRLIPDMLEFWQEGGDRLHDRLRYRRDAAEGWIIERLAP